MKKGITKTAPRVTDKSADFYRRIGGNINAGLEYVLESFPTLYRVTIDDLRGFFSRGELMLMIDAGNGLWLTPMMAGQHLLAQVSDGIALDHLDQKWKIDGGSLIRKIKDLPPFEAACLELWIQAFWMQDDHDNLEEYVAEMAKAD